MNLGNLLGNESAFGRLMTKCGTIIIINILFVVSCLPFFTIGAAGSAMYYTIFELLKVEKAEKIEKAGNAINPFKVYWQGFKKNFVRATLCWLVFAGVMILGFINLQVCAQWSGWIRYISTGVIAMMILAVVIIVYLLPVFSVFSGRLGKLIMMSIYIAIAHPLQMILILFLNVAPVMLLYMDDVNRPTYGFIGTFFGFGLIAYMIGKNLLPKFEPYLEEDKDE